MKKPFFLINIFNLISCISAYSSEEIKLEYLGTGTTYKAVQATIEIPPLTKVLVVQRGNIVSALSPEHSFCKLILAQTASSLRKISQGTEFIYQDNAVELFKEKPPAGTYRKSLLASIQCCEKPGQDANIESNVTADIIFEMISADPEISCSVLGTFPLKTAAELGTTLGETLKLVNIEVNKAYEIQFQEK